MHAPAPAPRPAEPRAVRRFWGPLVTLLVVISLGGPGFIAPAAAHGSNNDGHHDAQADDDTTDTGNAPTRSILIQPNSGTEPENFGDRGGLGQTLVFFLILGALAGGGLHIARHARRSRAALESAGQPS